MTSPKNVCVGGYVEDGKEMYKDCTCTAIVLLIKVIALKYNKSVNRFWFKLCPLNIYHMRTSIFKSKREGEGGGGGRGGGSAHAH